MGVLIARVDIYVDEELRWENGQIIYDRRKHTMKVRHEHRPVAEFTEVAKSDRERTSGIQFWDALDGDGNQVTISAAQRMPVGCQSCRS